MAEDRQTKLDQTMSSVTPERLEATRQEMEVERQKLSSPQPPPPPPPAGPPSEEPPPSEGTQRMKKLDLIQDVQLILVDKYRLGTKLMFGALGLLTLCLFALGAIIVKNIELHDRIATLQSEQAKLTERGAQIEKKTDETKESIDETKKQVAETQKRVDEAVEAAPKIEIDSSGKAKVVLPVKTVDPTAGSKPPSKKPPSPPSLGAPSSSAAAPPVPLPSALPVETKKF